MKQLPHQCVGLKPMIYSNRGGHETITPPMCGTEPMIYSNRGGHETITPPMCFNNISTYQILIEVQLCNIPK